MLNVVSPILESGRRRYGACGSDYRYGLNGMFHIIGPCGATLRIIASGAEPMPIEDRMGWEHVSISLQKRVPNWKEMCFVKDLFWHPEETVIQFHPPRSQYVNYSAYCLHLWREVGIDAKLPPSIMVGPVNETGA